MAPLASLFMHNCPPTHATYSSTLTYVHVPLPNIHWHTDAHSYTLPTYAHTCSVSSSYQDLMPQFLRAIRILCALHKHFVAAYKTMPPESIISGSVPSSPSIHGNSPRAASVKRAGSFGSLLDSPVQRSADRTRSRR